MGVCDAKAWMLAVLLVGCSQSEIRDGPALPPRTGVQTCLPDLPSDMPARLSQTGCFTQLATLEPAPELIPYEVNSPLWTDGAYKPRFVAVPKPERIAIEDDGSWTFPNGTILIKVFGFEFETGDVSSRRPVETRFMVRRDGRWEFSTYQWNDEGTDAERLDDGAVVDYTIKDNGQSHVVSYGFPAVSDCTMCHGASPNRVLGLKTNQMNRLHDYDGIVENQLVAMNAIGLFEGAQEIDPAQLPAMPSPLDSNGSREDRARAYVDANCAHCHRPGGFAPSSIGMDLRYETPLADAGVCDEPMKFFRWAGLPRISPGDSEGSGLFQRYVAQDLFRMPSAGTSVIDLNGADLIAAWIDGLSACPP